MFGLNVQTPPRKAICFSPTQCLPTLHAQSAHITNSSQHVLTLIGENTADTPPNAATTHLVLWSKAEYGFPDPVVTARCKGGRGGLAGGEGTYASSVSALRRVSGRSSGLVCGSAGAEAVRSAAAETAMAVGGTGAEEVDNDDVGTGTSVAPAESGDGESRSCGTRLAVGRSSIAGLSCEFVDDIVDDGCCDAVEVDLVSGVPRTPSPISTRIAFSIRVLGYCLEVMRDEVTPTSAWSIYVNIYQLITLTQPAISGHQTLSGTARRADQAERLLAWGLMGTLIGPDPIHAEMLQMHSNVVSSFVDC